MRNFDAGPPRELVARGLAPTVATRIGLAAGYDVWHVAYALARAAYLVTGHLVAGLYFVGLAAVGLAISWFL